MHDLWVLSLPESVSISATGRDGLRIASPFGRLDLRGFSAPRRNALCQLANPGRTLPELLAPWMPDAASAGRLRLLHDLRVLMRRRLLHFQVRESNKTLATLMPLSDAFEFPLASVPTGRFALSRFAYLRCEAGSMLLETPLSAARVVIYDPRVTNLLHSLVSPVTLASLGDAIDDLSPETIEAFICLLDSAQMLTAVNEQGRRKESERAGLKYWEFPDLLFHVRNRSGRHDHLMGASFAWVGVDDPPPALKPADKQNSLPLFVPELADLKRSDASYQSVSEQRCSMREYGSKPLKSDQLGEFLFRVARVKDVSSHELETPAGPVSMEFATRPYASAGALYELEIYPLILRCDGLAPGLYHYDPERHQLARTTAEESLCGKLAKQAAAAAAIQDGDLQVVLILSARFPRVMWKYSSMAYAAILKNVGVVYSSMYLAATAMNLAPCALGTGDSEVFSQAIKSNYYEETSVGEFLLGSLPERGRTSWSNHSLDSSDPA